MNIIIERELLGRISWLKEFGPSRNMFEKDSEEMLGKMNYSCSSNNILVVKLLNTYFGQMEEFVRAEILSILFTAGSLAFTIVLSHSRCLAKHF